MKFLFKWALSPSLGVRGKTRAVLGWNYEKPTMIVVTAYIFFFLVYVNINILKLKLVWTMEI